MAGATIWKGYIHFGSEDVPVKLHSAVRDERIQFHLLHNRDQARLRQQMVCSYEKRPVPPEEQARGFEIEEGKYILVRPEELEQLVPEADRKIDVHEFVRAAQIDPLMLERIYYLEPDASSVRSAGYGALADALGELDVAGICTWTMRKRSYFGALQARGGVLRLCTLRHIDEVVPASSLGIPEAALAERELAIGSELIEKLTTAFDPSRFEDEHEMKLRELIDRKARGEQIEVIAPRQPRATTPDELLQALEASLKKAA